MTDANADAETTETTPMQFSIDSTLTVDVALSDPIKLFKAAKKGDKETLKDAITVVEFTYDITQGD